MPQTTGTDSYDSGYALPFDAFLNGMWHPFSQGTIGFVNWNYTTNADFSARFSLLFNTFWTISQWYSEITDHSNTNLSQYINATTGNVLPDYQQATATFIRTHPAYKANYVWIVLLLVVATILLLCALLSLLLRILTIAPDILGFVSSFTRDSPYFEPLGPGGSLLDGEQRARRLRNVRVQIADVQPEAEVGHIAFVNLERKCDSSGDKQRYARLRKGRLYD